VLLFCASVLDGQNKANDAANQSSDSSALGTDNQAKDRCTAGSGRNRLSGGTPCLRRNLVIAR
jgi:hypothetical protein